MSNLCPLFDFSFFNLYILSEVWLVWNDIFQFCDFSQRINSCLIDSLYCFLSFFLSISLISSLNFIISCHLVLLGEFSSLCSRAYRWSVNFLIWDFSSFLCRHLVLWTFLLTLLSLCPITLGMLCGHFHWTLQSFNFFLCFFLDPFVIQISIAQFSYVCGCRKLVWVVNANFYSWLSHKTHGVIQLFLESVEVFFFIEYMVNFEKIPWGVEKKRRYTLISLDGISCRCVLSPFES